MKIHWTCTDDERPRPGSRVVWISPSGEEVEGEFAGGLIWFPAGSDTYIYYTPTLWRYAEDPKPLIHDP